MIELCGWIGSISFALCGVPQVIECYTGKKTISNWFILLWVMGDIFSSIYAIGTATYPNLLNYGASLICAILIWNKTLRG